MQLSIRQTSRPASVLIVDDDRPLLWALSTQLSKFGYRCNPCGNASEAMLQFAVRNFDLVITDITMPGIDGLSVLAMIRSQSGVPILVITGHSREYESLICGYQNVKMLRKPLEPQHFVETVRECLGRGIQPEAVARCA